jgi:transcriptional regulator with XRE-family HTH domain
MEFKKLVGLRIKELWHSKNMSQEMLADKTEISAKYLSSIERGKENPTLDTLIRLAKALEIEMWEMFDFGHIKSHKELKDSFQRFVRTADEPTLRLAFKIIRSVSR